MLHSAALKLLFPLELGPISDRDLEVEGSHLDNAQIRTADLLQEMFPDTAHELLPDWERVYGLTPVSGEPLQLRQQKLVLKLREIGDIKLPYFVALATELGYSINIEQLTPFMSGWSRAGDRIGDDLWWVWQITVLEKPAYSFRSGSSAAGETLGWSPAGAALESLFNDLKPADILMQFIYP